MSDNEIQVRHRARQDVARQADLLLERMGWAVDRADINLVQGRAVLVFKRHDGLLLSFDARGQDASLSRELRTWQDSPQRYGGRWESVFLGRSQWRGHSSDAIRGHLKRLAHYLADNAMSPSTRLEGRTAIIALMTAAEVCDE